MRRKISILIGILAVLMPMALAQSLTPDIGDALNNGFEILFNALTGKYVQFGLVIIFLIMLFYNIFVAGLSRVQVFGGSGGANKYGRMVALSLAIMATLGIMFFGENGPLDMMERILGSMGFIGGIALAAVIFGISYYNFKDGDKTWAVTFLSTGLGFIVFGTFTDSKGWWSFGWFFIMMGIIFFLFSGNKRGEGGQSGERAQRAGNWARDRGGKVWDRLRGKQKPEDMKPPTVSAIRAEYIPDGGEDAD